MTTTTTTRKATRQDTTKSFPLENQDALSAAIELAQIGCSSFVLDATEVQRAVAHVEKEAAKVMRKKDLVGMAITIGGGQVASAYRWTPSGTFVTVERKQSGWAVTSVCRKQFGSSTKTVKVKIPERAIDPSFVAQQLSY